MVTSLIDNYLDIECTSRDLDYVTDQIEKNRLASTENKKDEHEKPEKDVRIKIKK